MQWARLRILEVTSSFRLGDRVHDVAHIFRANQFLKLSVLVTRRVSEEPIKILANASGYHFNKPGNVTRSAWVRLPLLNLPAPS